MNGADTGKFLAQEFEVLRRILVDLGLAKTAK
jgi:hypothetical protein